MLTLVNPGVRRLLLALLARSREEDKRLHAGWSFGLMALTGTLLPLTWALCLVALIGVAKECWDHYYGTGFSNADLGANVVGMMAAIPFILSGQGLQLWSWLLG